jgi:hypothetical protein
VAPPGEHGALSARTVLEVADGLRWTDPRLGAALAEHALRLAGGDDAVRSAAERSVVRSLAEVDRFDEVVARAAPLLDAATEREDRDEVAGLLVELAAAAVGLADDAVAARLVEPVGSTTGLAGRTAARAALLRAQLAGAAGDVAATDRAAEEAAAAVHQLAEHEATLVRRDLARARAVARRRSGDTVGALTTVSGAVSTDPDADPDGGRRSLLAAADEVDLLLDLDRRDEAVARGRATLPADSAAPLVVCAAARIRLALAERVHLVNGAYAEAQALARTAATQLESAGHEAAAARAWEVVASAAERAGELGEALAAVRHAHQLESRSRDRRDPALRALAMIAAAAPRLPAPRVRAPAEQMSGEQAPGAGASTLSEVETLLADARSSVGEGADDPGPLPRRRSHHRQDDDDPGPTVGSRTMPEALARLLGAGSPSGSWPGSSERVNGSRAGDQHDGGTDGPDHPGELPTGGPTRPVETSRRSRHGTEADDGLDAIREGTPDAAAPSPPSDAVAPAPGSGLPDAAHPEATPAGAQDPTDTGSPSSSAPDHAPDPSPGRLSPWALPDPAEFPHIDPADPLGTGSSWRETPDRAVEGPEVNGAGRPAPWDDRRDEAGPPPGATTPLASGLDAPTADRLDGPHRDPAPCDTRTAPASPGRPSPRDGDAGRARETTTAAPTSAARSLPAGFDADDPDGELALTLAGLLAEYQHPDATRPAPEGERSADVTVPSARTHASGSMSLPATDQRFTPRPGDAPGPGSPAPGGSAGGRARRGENGAQLADLLAEAMDAFRHTGPGEGASGNGDGARGPGISSRPR